MMRQVREVFDNCVGYGYFATVPSNSHVVCAIFRGETALPDQLAIMYDTLRDMHLDSATHTYNVPVNENMPGNGTVVIISSKRAGILPTVFVENRLVTKLEDMIPRSALEEALDLDTGQLRFGTDTGNPNDTTSGDDQSGGHQYTYPQYTIKEAGHGLTHDQPALTEATGTRQCIQSNDFSYYQPSMPAKADSMGYIMMDSDSYGQPSAPGNTGGGMYDQGNTYAYQNTRCRWRRTAEVLGQADSLPRP